MVYVSRGAMAEVVSRRPVNAGVLHPFQTTSYAICVGQCVALGRFGLEYSVFLSHFHSINTLGACFTSFCLKSPCQFTSLLNLRFFFRFNALKPFALFDTNPFLICDLIPFILLQRVQKCNQVVKQGMGAFRTRISFIYQRRHII